MAEASDSERPFEATSSHLERAKREGNVARSTELSAVAAFACATLALCTVVGPIGSIIGSMVVCAIAQSASRVAAPSSFAALAMLGVFTAVPAAAAACAAAAVTLSQSGGLRLTPVTFSFEKLDPARGMKRIISRETLISGVRTMAAFACGACVLAPGLLAIFVGGVGSSSQERLATLGWRAVLRVIFAACAVGFVFSALDFAVEFSRWKKKLRMSFEQYKRDRKEHDGDPLVRGRRRALQRSFSTGSLMRIKDASFVVANPTHLAIALEYRPPDIAVPRVLVRGADEVALRVRALAKAHAVPIVEDVALARGLYATCDAGQVIPRETYVAVAEIVAALARTGAAH
ncbi:MAG: EscU/YscU/HrcU family type III secretion system export apparatus switch protein [Candidatus Eremiobacteraeota bacterium]|nr:EscU/YscU/HrcU family type III secretion system export apparatus switch protein [Candidatus Eremiobacteraeota bacterium]